MHCYRMITENLYQIGGDDRRLALFENIFPVPRGISYNSYLLKGDKNVLFDTVDHSVSRLFHENLSYLLQGESLDYLIINHMEPDHCSMVKELMCMYPDLVVVSTAKTVQLVQQFFGLDIKERVTIVKEDDVLEIGNHKLQFIMAPMVHWPEVMLTYDYENKVLFSADAFGTFGALNGNVFNDEMNFDRNRLDEARRYYANIVGKYGQQVQSVLKKGCKFEVEMICPLHGPIWRTDIDYILGKYQLWSTYTAEENGVVIAYASMYGNTENVVSILANKLGEAGIKNIEMYDVSNTHVSILTSEVFRSTHLILATPTYNAGIYPIMENFILDMKMLNVQNRKVTIIENGSWAPAAMNKIVKNLEEMKNMEIMVEPISIKSSITEEQLELLDNIVEKIVADFAEERIVDTAVPCEDGKCMAKKE